VRVVVGQDGPVRYVVIGAGAVGGTIGARLRQAGRDVVLVARGEHLAALRRDGIHLVAPDGDERLVVPAVGGPDELDLRTDDVLVLATKSQHTAEALSTWSAAVVAEGDGAGRTAGEVLPALCAQNGVANEPAALRWFALVAGVCVWLPAELPAPGTVLASCAPLSGMLHLGAYPPGRPDPGFEAVLDAVSADLEASRFLAPRPDDVMAWKRSKLLSNLGNAFDAFLVRDDAWRPLLEAAQDEARAVFASAGLAVTSDEEEAAVRGDRMQVADVPGFPRGGGSTYQSLARGTGNVETDWLNGEIVVQGRLLGVPTPVNAAVQALAARAVAQGRPARSVPVDELRALL
jgi:2-dehydropantoate 2-reductase